MSDPFIFDFVVPPGSWLEVVSLTFGRARLQVTDGFGVGDFW